MHKTPKHVSEWKREDMQGRIDHCIHAARSSGQADLYALQGDATGWVLKDFVRRPLWIRMLITRRGLSREVRALKGLQELDGVPRFGGVVDSDAFVMERLDAHRLPHKNEAPPSIRTLEAIDRLVERMHARGWAHGDLRRKNILVDPDGRPYLIDFATAVYGGKGSGPIGRFLLRRVAVVDRVNVARIKAGYCPDALSNEERELLAAQPLHLRFGRFLRKKIYRPLKRKHRRETMRRIFGRFFRGRK
ncbi:MAG: phosphotransferase [Candidatus Sumerlaeota bacterium]